MNENVDPRRQQAIESNLEFVERGERVRTRRTEPSSKYTCFSTASIIIIRTYFFHPVLSRQESITPSFHPWMAENARRKGPTSYQSGVASSDGYRYRPAPNIPESGIGMRYRNSYKKWVNTDTEIPEIPEYGISVFALPLSECPV